MLEDGDEAGASEAFFDFRVADLAMGSGHFLGRCRGPHRGWYGCILDRATTYPTSSTNSGGWRARLETHSGSRKPTTKSNRQPCYVDKLHGGVSTALTSTPSPSNLARVAIWIHTFVPGLPMSSLNHTLVCANSLTGVGTTDEALESLEPDRKAGMPSLFSMEIEEALEEARKVLVDAANTSEATKAEVRQAIQAAP